MEQVVRTVQDYHAALASFGTMPGLVWRGQADARWRLVPRIGRPQFDGIEEHSLYSSWKRRALVYLDRPPTSEWDWLCMAQHHGLATRLLDWTRAPLNALYFAVGPPFDADGRVYGLAPGKVVSTAREPHPLLLVSGVQTLLSSSVVARISRQDGLFTVHGNPAEELSGATSGIRSLRSIRIDAGSKVDLRRELAGYGVNEDTLFGDLDALSRHILWMYENRLFGHGRSSDLDG